MIMSNKKEEILKRLDSEILILDGAMGTELQKRGMPSGVCPEVWTLENPEVLKEIQREYSNSGADMIYSCTFGGNPVKLNEYGYDNVEEINRELVRISREAVGPHVLIAGDISSTGRFIEPFGDFPFDEAVDTYRRQVRGLKEGGVDLFVIETQIDIQEARAALIAVKEETDDFVLVTMTFEKDGRTLNGTTPEAAVITLQSLGADAVGINCSTGPAEMLSSIKRMADVSRVPLAVKPNAGMPRMENGRTVFPMAPEEFGGFAPAFRDAGISFFGGCCGTTPGHIQVAAETLGKSLPKRTRGGEGLLLSSARGALITRSDSPLRIIGERINPTGKKKLQAELKKGEFSIVSAMAREQKNRGADLLDINAGMADIDEKETLLNIIRRLSTRIDLPLVIDSSDPDVVEAAVRLYPGRALLNSLSGETVKLEKLLPVIEKYGCAFVLLPLVDSELPETGERRMEIVHQVYKLAEARGAERQDVLVDGLVMTVSSKPDAPAETLKTIRECTKEGFGSVLGLSNVSFGLPSRGWLNAAFLSMAQASGLTFAIANPGHDILMNIKTSGELLLGKDPRGAGYIKRIQNENSETVKDVSELEAGERVYQGVLNGESSILLSSLEECLKNGDEPKALLEEFMIPAILKTGELYDEKKYYLPQLMASAEAMRDGFTRLEKLLGKNEGGSKPDRIVFATVQGDIHDIGKNIVILMLRNYGFEVIDLGKDVPSDIILDAVKKYTPKVLALSALMTTTMIRMPEIIERLRAEGYDIPVMVGGAVITSEWSESIGAHYSRDGVEAVRLAGKLVMDK